MNAVSDRKTPLALKLLGVAGLAAAGGATGFVRARFVDRAAMPWADALATGLSGLLLATALISAGVMATRPSDVQKGCGLLQIAVFILAGLLLLLPIYGSAWFSPDMVFWGIAVLLAVQSAANLMLWKQADEMLQRVMWETSAMAFWALQLALFLYAAAERLGLVEGLTAWGMLGILMGVYLVASVIASWRRGMK
jgi:hypothetical protein